MNSNGKRPLSDIARYSNLAFQMIGIILAGTLGGRYLDSYFQLPFPALTLSGTLLSVFAAVYLTIKEFLHNNSRKP